MTSPPAARNSTSKRSIRFFMGILSSHSLSTSSSLRFPHRLWPRRMEKRIRRFHDQMGLRLPCPPFRPIGRIVGSHWPGAQGAVRCRKTAAMHVKLLAGQARRAVGGVGEEQEISAPHFSTRCQCENGTFYRGAGHGEFVAVFGQWLGGRYRHFAGLSCDLGGDLPAGEKLLHGLQAPGNRGDAGKHYSGARHCIAVALDDGSHADFGMGPGGPVHELEVAADRILRRRRHQNSREEFGFAEHILVDRIHPRQDKELRRRHFPLAIWPGKLEYRLVSHEHRRDVRGMHDKARAAAENRVLAVFTVHREALVAAGLEAIKAVAVIPAPGALGHVAGEGSDIADLWRADAFRSLDESRQTRAEGWMSGYLGQGDKTTDADAAVARFDLPGLIHRTQIDDEVCRISAVL